MRVFVFGHYDSRGGTVAIQATDKESAFTTYALYVDAPDTYGQQMANEDYLGETELLGADDMEWGDDLDEIGWVVPTLPFEGLPSPSDISNNVLTYYHGEISADLVTRARWNDDAFGFILIKE